MRTTHSGRSFSASLNAAESGWRKDSHEPMKLGRTSAWRACACQDAVGLSLATRELLRRSDHAVGRKSLRRRSDQHGGQRLSRKRRAHIRFDRAAPIAAEALLV